MNIVEKRANPVKIFVAGSIHLDILSAVTAFPETIDKVGRMEIEVGGTAYNIAMNLKVLGADEIVFCTALKDSPLSKMLLENLKDSQITTVVEFDDSLPQSGFNAHMHEGDMFSAVSSIAVEHYTFEESPEIIAQLESSHYMVLDCNLNVQSLCMFINLARKFSVPVVLSAVSEGKALKLLEIPEADFIFMNNVEYEYLIASSSWSPSKAVTIIKTKGKDGADAFHGSELVHSTPAAKITAALKNYLGAGDAYCAGIVYSLLKLKVDLNAAMAYATIVSRRVIQAQNCNAGADSILDQHLNDLRNQAEKDDLTKLFMRKSGMDFLAEQAIEFKTFNKSISLFFADLDKFKDINDTYGHDVGDEALRIAASTLTECLRDTKDMACRWGGEEMVAVLPDCALAEAAIIANRYREILKTKEVPGMDRRLSVSIGVTQLETDQSIDDLIKTADHSMYLAKENGRDRVVIHKPQF